MTTPDWSSPLRHNRAMQELLRMVRAVIRDGEVSELEAEFLRFWLAENPDLMGIPPLDRVVPSLHRLMEGDEVLDPGARRALLDLLAEVAGEFEPPGGRR